MKKAFLFLGLAAAAFTLTNCNKQESDFAGADAIEARIQLLMDDTKTVNDGLNTLWAEGDALSVWVADATAPSVDYGSNLKFDVDAETGTASGTVEELPGTSNWYAFYPYNKNLVNPTSLNDEQQRKGYMTIGSQATGVQTQAGNDSKAHLAGANLPLYGVARGVTDAPSIVMKQICGVIAVKVTNGTQQPLTVSSVAVTASDNLIGTYYIDFSSDVLGFEGSGDNYVSKTATLTVSNGEAIAAGASATFYLAVKPVDDAALASVKVVADQGEVLKESVASVIPLTVASGHIKTINFTYEAPEQIDYISVSDAVSASDGDEVVVGDAIVAALSTKGYIITDGSANVYVYKNGTPDVALGDKVNVTATKTTYYDLPELTGPVATVVSSNNDIPRTDLVDITSSIDNYSSSTADYIAVTGTLEKSGNYYNVRVSGATRYASPDYLISSIDPSALVGQEVTMTGYFNTIHSKNNYVKVIVTEIVGTGATPAATLSSIEVSNPKTSYNVGDQFEKPTVTAYYSDQSSKDVTASATFSGYDLTKAGNYTVTVSYTEGNETKTTSYSITVVSNDDPNVNTVSVTISDYVQANQCTIASGSGTQPCYTDLDLNSSVRMSTTGNPNCGAFYGNGAEWRLYQNQGGNIIILVGNGCSLKSVKFTYTVTNGGVLKDATGADVKSNDVYETTGTSVEFQVGNTGDATNGQVRVTAVEVKYTGNGSLPPVDTSDPGEITTSISLTSSASVYVGETVQLNASSNVQGAAIVFSSEDESIATVDENGLVSGVAVGTVKIYARITGVAGSYTDAERYCNVTVNEKPQDVGGSWEATALSSIADGAQFVLVGTNANGSFAMSNNGGTSSAPAAVAVTISGSTLSNPASNVVFTMQVTSGGYVFTTDDGEKWVYTTTSNNGIRVGTGTNNVFNLEASSGYLTISDGSNTRYLGIYNSQDWRSYTSINSNIKDQTFTFFVKK